MLRSSAVPRRVVANDLPRLLPLYAALLGRNVTLESLKARAGRLPHEAHWLIENGPEVLAVCDWEPNDFGPPGSLRLGLWVQPQARGRGHGSALLQLASRTGTALSANIEDDDPAGLAWAERRGFALHAHRFESTLDLEAFAPDPHRAPLPPGVELGDMTRASERDWDELTALLIDTFAQTPDAQGLPRWSWETARKALQFNPQLRPDWLVCARRDTELLGFTAALDLPGMAYNQMTSVREATRGQNLAYALKTALLGRLKADGVTRIRTHNHAANVAVRRVNAKLGYRQQHGRWEVRRGMGRS